MAVNTKIFDRLIQELINEKSSSPYTHYVYDEKTKQGYEVIIQKVNSKRYSYITESKNIIGMTVSGPAGEPCGCCNGSGRSK